MRFSKTFQMAVSGRYSHGGHYFFPTPCPHFFLALPNFRVPSPDHGMEEQNREHMKISLAYLKHCIFPTLAFCLIIFFSYYFTWFPKEMLSCYLSLICHQNIGHIQPKMKEE